MPTSLDNLLQEYPDLAEPVKIRPNGPLPSDIPQRNMLIPSVRFDQAQAKNMDKQSNGLREQTAPWTAISKEASWIR